MAQNHLSNASDYYIIEEEGRQWNDPGDWVPEDDPSWPQSDPDS